MTWDAVRSAIVRIFGPWGGTATDESSRPGSRTKWTHAQAIKVIESADGKAKVTILKRRDGLFEFQGEAEIRDEDEYVGVYWASTEHSGLYENAEQAERDAHDEVPWLRQLSRRD